MDSDLVTTTVFAKHIGVPVQSVWEVIRAGRLSVYDKGGACIVLNARPRGGLVQKPAP